MLEVIGLELAILLLYQPLTARLSTDLLAFHQQAADELGGDALGGAGEEVVGEVLVGRGG